MVFKHVKAIGYGETLQHEDKAIYDLLQTRAIFCGHTHAISFLKKNQNVGA